MPGCSPGLRARVGRWPPARSPPRSSASGTASAAASAPAATPSTRVPTPTSTSSSPRACRSRCRRCGRSCSPPAGCRRSAAGRWCSIEDADRLTEAASNALLKAVEEPPQRTVFLLCAPSTHPDDVTMTIRSRCRVVPLRSRPAEAVAEVLIRRDGIDPAQAEWAAQASQGHVGRARRLARDADARARRAAVLAMPASLTSLGACLDAADHLVRAAEAEAAALSAELDGAGDRGAQVALGAGGTGKGAAAAVRGIGRRAQANWSGGRGPAPPGPSGMRWTARWSTWPRSTGTCCWPSRARTSRPAHPDFADDVLAVAAPARARPGRCAGSTRCSPAARRSSSTSSRASPSRR